jgi:hypothetical protein
VNHWFTPHRSSRATHAAPVPLSGVAGPCVSLSLSLSLSLFSPRHRSAFRRSTESSRATIFTAAPSGATHARAHRTTPLQNRSFSTTIITIPVTITILIRAFLTVLFSAYSHYDLATSQTWFLRCEQLPRWARPRNPRAARLQTWLQQKLVSEPWPCGVEDTCGAALHVQQGVGSTPIANERAHNRKNTFLKFGRYAPWTGSAISRGKRYILLNLYRSSVLKSYEQLRSAFGLRVYF